MKRSILIVSMVLLWVNPSWALFDMFTDDEQNKRDLSATAEITLQKAVIHAVNEKPGKVVEAELEKEGDRLVYEVEILGDDGKFYEVYIDAKSGKTVKMEKD
ncbi:PepSY domain-containing protein [Candidatus Nitronereus thalassa]|uniref:PepSY domain-containing protein n=1 Tax=Candidatus Nitronereus thalassa TaxID=3020898 RepID=A0ABU3KBE0_9BACT|nr:PepSY domain-containing protein [Candidatus Nitronereus thalassa]MDT7043711.1 PepSY domain-containing protein [Candidatus Nitronereus thalassa]